MKRLYMVRHGKAAASFAEALDPGLDEVGRRQAEEVATRMAPLGPLPIVTSPLRRARETAAPLERQWARAARVEPAVAEVPSPFVDPPRRLEWLRRLMDGRWPEMEPTLRAWRDAVVAALVGTFEPTLVFTHYVVINVAMGHALGDDRVRVFAPDHASVTVFDVAGAALRVVERGSEGTTRVL